LDLLILFLSLPVTVPVMLLMAGFIKLVSPGPVFFAQDRIGYRGRSFKCLKFRTMSVNSAPEPHRDYLRNLLTSDVPMAKLDGRDPRVIPCGRLLRASGLDELAQFINILRGEMSLVGPRPCTPYEFEHYQPWQRERFGALPGLTGLWQVSGKNRTTFVEMVQLDIHYVRNQSPWMDCRILGLTPAVVCGQMAQLLHRRFPTKVCSSEKVVPYNLVPRPKQRTEVELL
jgi:lipopolysaccharide/colanic/teichoic acid biosynthesis glycosyltransferase